MPILRANRETKKINLLSDPEAAVEVYAKQTYGDYLAIQKVTMGNMKVNTGTTTSNGQEVSADLTAFMMTTLERMIVSWNFTDENGVALPVTRDNLMLLDTDDALHVFNTLSGDTTQGLPQDDNSKKVVANS